MGRSPDAEVAVLAGVPVQAVKDYRRERSIEAFHQPPPSSAGAVVTAAPAVTGTVVRRRAGARESVRAEAATVTRTEGAPAAHPLATFRDRLGTVADDVIAREAGVSRQMVGEYRRELGIRAYDGFRFAASARPAAPAVAVVEAVPAATAENVGGSRFRRGKLDAFAHLMGKESDATIAALAGATRAGVKAHRERHGIAPPPASAESAPAPLRSSSAGPERVDPSAVRRPSRLDAYRHIVGVLFDSAVAEIVGMSAESVRLYRKRYGIRAGTMRSLSDTPPPAPVATPTLAASVLPAVAAPLVVPPSLAPRLEAGLAGLRGFLVRADAGDGARRFLVIGPDMATAAQTAVTALAQRQDGPWRVRDIRDVAEGLA